MSHTATLQIFRTATASLSTRAVARTTAGAGQHRSALRARFYSDDKAPNADKNGEKAKDNKAEEDPRATVGGQLKAKEEEVADLTVRVLLRGPLSYPSRTLF